MSEPTKWTPQQQIDNLANQMHAERQARAHERNELLEVLGRALFVLESPVIMPLANGAGTVDLVRTTISKMKSKYP